MFAYQPSFVRRGAVSIAYYDIGQGKPLVLLHGNGEDSSYWTGQIAEFTRFYRVIAVDSRGHGASGCGSDGLSFALMAEDPKAVLDACGIQKNAYTGIFGWWEFSDQVCAYLSGICGSFDPERGKCGNVQRGEAANPDSDAGEIWCPVRFAAFQQNSGPPV